LQLYIYVLGLKLSVVRLCDCDFGITPVDDITIGITCAAFCFHIAHISLDISWYFFLFVGYCFGEIMCIWDSYVYQKGALCFLIHKSYVRSIKSYYFFRQYAAFPVQPEIFIPQYNGWCVLIIWASAASAIFWWIIFASPSHLFTYSVAASCSHASVMCQIVSDSFP